MALGLAASCASAQTAPSPADVGISKGTPDVFKLKGHDNVWTPFGTVDPSTHIFAPNTNGPIAPNDCVKWGPGLTSAGAACNSVTGGASPANQLTIYTNHAGLLANVTTPTEAWTVVQQGFYAPGDGGEASYEWNATSLCPGGAYGTPTALANGLSCILPIGQSPATPGRYILNLTNGSINVRQFGMQPGIGTAFDNSPFVNPMMQAIAIPGFGPNGPDIIIPATLGQIYTNYYFSEPFEITHGSSLRCNMSGGTSAEGSKVGLMFPAGIPGVIQQTARMAALSSGDTSSIIIGCTIGALGRFSTGSGATPGASTIATLLSSAPPQWNGVIPLLAAGDGVFLIGGATPKAPLVVPGAYIQSATPPDGSGYQTITLAPPFVVGHQEILFGSENHAALGWRLPANEMYHIQATAGSANAVITGGRRPLKAGTLIWSQPFVFGSELNSVNNAVTGTPTVNSGGSGYGTGSGTMTWAGAGCYQGAPVLNVTASEGVITAVTGVANAGSCDGAWIPSTGTTWTPGGGLSAGSGASFNLTFQNNVKISTIAGWAFTSPASLTGTYNLWGLSAGLERLVGAGTRGARVEGFPIGLEMFCDNGIGGCATSFDEHSSFSYGAIGRFVTGSDSAPSTAIGNEYDENRMVDILEAAALGSVYINENANSMENNFGAYSVLGSCGSLNYSIFIGGYLSGDQSDGMCMGIDVNGNINIGVPPRPYDIVGQGSFLSIGANIGNTATVAQGGGLQGVWSFQGYGKKTQLANAATAVGGTSISLASINRQVGPNWSIADATNPTAIPSGATVTKVGPGANVTISAPVAAPGVANNDKIVLSLANPPCIRVQSGVDIDFALQVQCGTSPPAYNLEFVYSGAVGAWGISDRIFFTTPDYAGYKGLPSPTLVVPLGMALGADDVWVLGEERTLDIGPQPFVNKTHLEGDTRFNRQPVPGGNMAWAYVSAFTTTLSANLVAGTTTSVGVAACPNPALPAGTPIDTADFDERRHVGDLASCVGTTLTLQAAALANSTSGWQVQFMQSRQAAHIANDAAGTSWPVATVATIANLAPCTGGANIGLGIAYDGQTAAAAGYNAPVGSTTGGTIRLVFCDGASWTYH